MVTGSVQTQDSAPMRAGNAPVRIAILMTCFNRRAVTLEALASLQRQEGLEQCAVDIYLVDDGSSDGTADAVQQQFPAVRLLRGDGSLFWNGGMRRAFSAAIAEGHDAYVWFNDDTTLQPNALARLLATERAWQKHRGPAIVVGSVHDATTGTHTYGGFRMRTRGLSMQLEPVLPDAEATRMCDSMNGNFVLIPAGVVAVLGNLEQRFRHQIGDVDYGLRARAAGFDVVLAPGYFGCCSNNSSAGTWRDQAISFRRRWKNLMSPKGAPPREWLLYTRRHYGWRWPLYFVSPYVKTAITSLAARRRTSAAA